MTAKLSAKDTTVAVVGPDGETAQVKTAHYPKDVRLDPKWKLGTDKVLVGHVGGYYADHRDEKLQEMAYAWKLAGRSTTDAYQALRLQSGTLLGRAADAYLKRMADAGTPVAPYGRQARKLAAAVVEAAPATKAG